MIEQVVEVVDRDPLLKARFQWPYLLIGLQKRPVEPTEQPGHGKVGLGPAVVSGRINQVSAPLGAAMHVARPQITMQRGRRLSWNQFRQAFAEKLDRPGVAALQ